MFEAMPPGQLATRMMPTASPVSSCIRVATSQPQSGMIVSWAPKPRATAPGILPMDLKSSRLRVNPIPSMEAASDQKIHSFPNHNIVCGKKKATVARLTSQTG